MLAFSKEWIDAVAEALRNDEVYQHKAQGFDSYYQFVVKAAPDRGVPEDKACGLYIPDCNDSWDGIRPNSEYVMSGSYDVFHQIITGKLGPVVAITTRKVMLKGNLAKLLKFTGATLRFVKVLEQIQCEFEGDWAK